MTDEILIKTTRKRALAIRDTLSRKRDGDEILRERTLERMNSGYPPPQAEYLSIEEAIDSFDGMLDLLVATGDKDYAAGLRSKINQTRARLNDSNPDVV